MVLDVPTLLEEDDSEDAIDELNLDLEPGTFSGKSGLRTLHISHLLQMVLQDAQTRLFFKAQSVIQSEIRYYVPKPEDLAYPDILLGECVVPVCLLSFTEYAICRKLRESRYLR